MLGNAEAALINSEFSQSDGRFRHNIPMSFLQNKPQLVLWTEPSRHSDGHDLLCAYFINSPVAPAGSVALLKFESVLQYRFGYPNDEALQGHPLYHFGLKPYDFFVVENSPLIDEIEKQNRYHPQHRPGIYAKFPHWVITFHDETLEVIALRGTIMGQTQLSPDRAVCEVRPESKQSPSPGLTPD
jgi:hypothetical protein